MNICSLILGLDQQIRFGSTKCIGLFTRMQICSTNYRFVQQNVTILQHIADLFNDLVKQSAQMSKFVQQICSTNPFSRWISTNLFSILLNKHCFPLRSPGPGLLRSAQMDSAPLSTLSISPVLGEVETLGGVRIFENPASGFPQTVRQRGSEKHQGGCTFQKNSRSLKGSLRGAFF